MKQRARLTQASRCAAAPGQTASVESGSWNCQPGKLPVSEVRAMLTLAFKDKLKFKMIGIIMQVNLNLKF